MAHTILSQARKLSRECVFTGKSQAADPSNVVVLRGPGAGVPNSVNGKVPPRRIPNKQRRTREYLTEREVDLACPVIIEPLAVLGFLDTGGRTDERQAI